MAEQTDGYGDWRSLDLAIKDAAKKAAAGPARRQRRPLCATVDTNYPGDKRSSRVKDLLDLAVLAHARSVELTELRAATAATLGAGLVDPALDKSSNAAILDPSELAWRPRPRPRVPRAYPAG